MENDVNDPSQDVARWIEEITRRSLAEQMRSLQRYNELIQRLSSGELDQDAVRQEYLRFVQEESQRYLQRLAQASMSYYNQLNEISRSYNELFFNQVLKAGHQPPHNGDAHRAPRQVEMTLLAVLGEEAAGSFVLENKRAEAAEISFMVSPFEDEGGQVRFRPPLQIRPPHFRLGPFEETEVRMSLPVLPELFEAGKTYRTTILVRGYDDLELLLNVQVEPARAVEEEFVLRPIQARPELETPSETAQVETELPPGDDLGILAGLGQSYTRKLNACGIFTFAQLGEADLEASRALLGADGLRRARLYRWQEQARLAAAGEFSRLAEFRKPRSGQNQGENGTGHES